MILSYALALLTTGPTAEAPPTSAQPPVLDPALAPSLYTVQDDGDGEWHGNVALGASTSNGNANVTTASASAEGIKEWDIHRVTLRGGWNFAQQEDQTTGASEVTQRRWNGFAKYDRFLDELTYLYASLAVENDDIAALHLRQIYSLGAGHKFADDEDYKLDGEAGLAYVDENYFGSVDDDEYTALRLAYALFYRISENTTFRQNAEMFPSLDFSEFNGTLDSRIKVNMTDKMFAMLQWIARYNNNAPPGTGSTDNLWILSVGWEF